MIALAKTALSISCWKARGSNCPANIKYIKPEPTIRMPALARTRPETLRGFFPRSALPTRGGTSSKATRISAANPSRRTSPQFTEAALAWIAMAVITRTAASKPHETLLPTMRIVLRACREKRLSPLLMNGALHGSRSSPRSAWQTSEDTLRDPPMAA